MQWQSAVENNVLSSALKHTSLLYFFTATCYLWKLFLVRIFFVLFGAWQPQVTINCPCMTRAAKQFLKNAFFQKYNSIQSGTIRGQVNSDRIFIFGPNGQFKIFSDCERRKYFSSKKLHTYYITFNTPEREETVSE